MNCGRSGDIYLVQKNPCLTLDWSVNDRAFLPARTHPLIQTKVRLCYYGRREPSSAGRTRTIVHPETFTCLSTAGPASICFRTCFLYTYPSPVDAHGVCTVWGLYFTSKLGRDLCQNRKSTLWTFKPVKIKFLSCKIGHSQLRHVITSMFIYTSKYRLRAREFLHRPGLQPFFYCTSDVIILRFTTHSLAG